jgi:UDP-glucose 4-epimerase
MSIFLTGSESFLGRALIARCQLIGIPVVGVDIIAPNSDVSKMFDIRDPALADMIPEGATVVHLAAISRDPDCRADPREAFDINVQGTFNVASAAQKKSARQLVFASSEWVYGDVRNDEIQLEDRAIDITTMKSEYAITKIVSEQALRLACTLPSVTVLRFGIVYGPRTANWSAVENLFNAARKEDEIKIGSAHTARRFIHVEDIISGILASRGRSGFEIFNLSGDKPISLGDVVKTSSDVWGRTVRVVETNPSHPSIRNPDNAKARASLGWAPEFDLLSGLMDLKKFFEKT